MKLYKNLLFTGCYDGFIYVHKKDSNKIVGKLHGPGKMLLDFELVNNKVRYFVCIDKIFKSKIQNYLF